MTHPQCHVYICGGSNMAEDVNRALEAVAGTNCFTSILEDGR